MTAHDWGPILDPEGEAWCFLAGEDVCPCARTWWTPFRCHTWSRHHLELRFKVLGFESASPETTLSALLFLLIFCLCKVLPTPYLFLASSPLTESPLLWVETIRSSNFPKNGDGCHSSLDPHECLADAAWVDFTWLWLPVLCPFLILPRDFLTDM